MVSTAVCSNELKELSQIGDRFFDLGKFEIALQTFQEALEIARTHQQKISIFHRIGLVYCRLENYSFALKFLKLALQIAKETGCQNQVVMILNDIGQTYCLSIDYISALRYYAQALETAQNFCNLRGMGITLNHLAEIYNLLGLFDKTLNCSQKSMEIFYKFERKSVLDKLYSQIYIALSLHNIGEAYLWLGKSSKAREILELTLSIRHKICKVSFKHFSKVLDDFQHDLHPGSSLRSKKITQSLQTTLQDKMQFSQSILSQDQADLANTMNLIEKVYRNLNHRKKADDYLQQKLKIWETCSNQVTIKNTYFLPFYLKFNCANNSKEIS
ncbi:MAG: tetratricopeptide repeat protein [Trichodesmium sp.]